MERTRKNVAGEYYTHMYLWNACNELVKTGDEVSSQKEHRSLYYHMTGMLMAYLAYEAYLNFVGFRLLPEAWKNERGVFSKGEYGGIEGKLKIIVETCAAPSIDKSKRPYQTIISLGELRNFLVHGKPRIFEETITHHEGDTPDMFPDKFIYEQCSPESAHRAVQDVEEFIEYLHSWVLKRLPDEFTNKPLDMSLGSSHSIDL